MAPYLYVEKVTARKVRASERLPEISADPFATLPSESNGEEDPAVEGVPQAASEWGSTGTSRIGPTSQCQRFTYARA